MSVTFKSYQSWSVREFKILATSEARCYLSEVLFIYIISIANAQTTYVEFELPLNKRCYVICPGKLRLDLMIEIRDY